MTSKLILIRGNSGSGKSTIASQLQRHLGRGTMLIPQDVIRREILRTQDETGNPAIELIYRTALYGKEINYTVIIEGILPKEKYGSMLTQLINDFYGNTHTYYFDISFEETVRRHAMKSSSNEYGEKELREWWLNRDLLGVDNEKIFTDIQSEKEILDSIIDELNLPIKQAAKS